MSETRNLWLSKVSAGLSERDARLLDRASALLEANIMKPLNEQVWNPLRGICPSPQKYQALWNWDSAFHAMAVARWDMDLAKEQVAIFLNHQRISGALPDVIRGNGDIVTGHGKPPVFPWVCLRMDEIKGGAADFNWIRSIYGPFKSYELYLRRYRAGWGSEMFHYDCDADEVKKDKERAARWESGWDNSVRWDPGITKVWAIDLNCYMVLFYRTMYEFAHLLQWDEEDEWADLEDNLTADINNKLWHDELGAYCDTYRANGKPTGILSPASFMPLYLGITHGERAEKMAKLAADPAKFYPGMPTVSYDHPDYSSYDYWRGPTWLNAAWFACKGLQVYADDTASSIRETILNWCDADTDTIWEYYDSKTGKGLGAPQFGWSAAFIIEFILDW